MIRYVVTKSEPPKRSAYLGELPQPTGEDLQQLTGGKDYELELVGTALCSDRWTLVATWRLTVKEA